MQFTRLFVFLTAFLALGSFVLASPAVTKRQDEDSQITSIVDTLQSSVEPAVSSLKSLDPSTATANDAAPYITDIINAFNTAAGSLGSLAGSTSGKRSVAVEARQTAFDTQIAQLIAGLLTDVAEALDGLLGVPGLGALLPGLDPAINQVLLGLETLLSGVLNFVAQLLVDVAGILNSLALGLTLATLGL